MGTLSLAHIYTDSHWQAVRERKREKATLRSLSLPQCPWFAFNFLSPVPVPPRECMCNLDS